MKDPRFAKFVVFINSLVPLAILGWDAYMRRLGADPVTFALHTTGMLALIFLLLSLSVTPLRLITGKNWLSHFRRMLGLYAFFYAGLHLLTYFIFDRGGSLRSLISETAKRPFILFGMTALILMVPLAITSTNGMVKRLGAARWKRLHQLAYVSAIAGVVHYYCSSKVTSSLQIAFITALVLLLGYRIAVKWLPFLKYRKIPADAVRAARASD